VSEPDFKWRDEDREASLCKIGQCEIRLGCGNREWNATLLHDEEIMAFLKVGSARDSLSEAKESAELAVESMVSRLSQLTTLRTLVVEYLRAKEAFDSHSDIGEAMESLARQHSCLQALRDAVKA